MALSRAYQPSGENINIFPEVSGPVVKVLVKEGQQVSAGTVLFTIDDSVQKATVELAEATLKVDQDQYDKDLASYDIDPKSISKNVLDTAKDTVDQEAAALKAARALLKKYTLKAPIDGVVWPLTRRSAAMCPRRGIMILTRSYLILL